MSRVVILGAGDHGRVVADILLCARQEVVAFLDVKRERWGIPIHGIPVPGDDSKLAGLRADGVVAGVGDNRTRHRIVAELLSPVNWVNAIHPSAVVSPWAKLGRGVVIAAGAVVNPDAEVGDFAIVNTGATVDHDCCIGPFAQVAPGVHLAGRVMVGEGAMIGTGAAVVPGCTIGAWAVIGAGAVVTKNIPAGVTAKGVPARWKECS